MTHPKDEALKLAAEFDKRFTSMNGVDVPERVSVPRDEWRALHQAIKAAAPVPLTDDQARDMPDCWVVIKDGRIIATHDEPCHHDGIQAVRYAPAAQPAVPLTDDVVQKIISKLEPLLDAKNQSWAEAERMLHGITKGQS